MYTALSTRALNISASKKTREADKTKEIKFKEEKENKL